jgi:hypothetical protein
MPITLNGTTGITTPGLINTGSTTFVDLTTTGNTILGDQSTDTLNVANGNLVLNSSGKAGLGVTPSAWTSEVKALQIFTTGALWANSSTIFLTNNTFTDGTDKYLTTAAATRYYQSAGLHIWNTAASGTAGNAVTFTQTMTLDASGNLGIGTASPNQKLYVVGNGLFDGGFTYWTATGSTPGSTAPAIWSPASGVMGLWTNGAERARIDSSGNLIVGSTSASAKLDVTGTTNIARFTSGTRSLFAYADTQGTGIFTTASAAGTTQGVYLNSANDYTALYTNGSERTRVTSGGDVGIGRTDPPMRFSAASAGAVISGTATIGTNMQGIQIYNTTTATTNNAVGLWFATGPHQAGIASFRADATGGWDTTLAFYTHGATTNQLNDCFERMRIDGNGTVFIGKSAASTTTLGWGLNSDGSGGSTFTITNNEFFTWNNYNGSGSVQMDFRWNNTEVGSISYTSSAVAYNTTSDYRLKDNPQVLTGSGAFIDALQPKTWSWKIDGSRGVGFIAHEVQAISPSSVSGEKDAMRDDGVTPKYQSVEYGSAEFIANIILELQSLRARVAQLEAKGAA